MGELLGAGLAAAGIPAMAADAVRPLATLAVGMTMDYYTKRGDAPIAVFYESLTGTRTKTSKPWGVGLHPADYPGRMIQCGDAMNVAYEVSSVRA